VHLWRPPRSFALAPFVDSIEYVEDTPGTAQERMIPGGGTSLVVTLRDDGFSYLDGDQVRWVDGACIAGPQQRAQVISTAPQRGMISINFAPGGALPFVPLPLHALTDSYPSLQEVWGRAGGVVRERMLAQRPQRVLDLAEEILLEQAVGPLGRPQRRGTGPRSIGRGRRRALRHDGQAVHPPLPRGDGADAEDVCPPPSASAPAGFGAH
jgi:hypothetical protein